MILRNFVNSDRDNNIIDNINGDLRSLGILDYRRNIIVFVEPCDYNNLTTVKGKIIIINECIYEGFGGTNIIHFNIPNSILIRSSVYFGEVFFQEPNNVKTSMISLRSAVCIEKQRLYSDNFSTDQNLINYRPTYVSNDLSKTDQDIIDTITAGFELYVLPPKYYTEKHMVNIEGDFYNIFVDGTCLNIDCSELIDRSTKIHFMDINSYDTLKEDVLNNINNQTNSYTCKKYEETFSLSDSIISGFDNYIGSDTIFIYDSDSKGKSKINIKDGIVPYGKYYPKEYLINNLNSCATMFEQSCKDIEDIYGHIRVHCSPNKIGNKVKIKFKDYNISPIMNINNLSNDPSRNIIHVDNGYNISKNVEETLYVVGKNNSEASYNEMFQSW